MENSKTPVEMALSPHVSTIEEASIHPKHGASGIAEQGHVATNE